MQIHVRFFAAAREAAGCTEEVAELPEASQILDLRRWLLDRHPELRSVEPQLRYAIGHDFVDLETALVDGAQVALIPPVGGG